MAKQYTQILTIAGSDSSGGAGIQADLKTFSALGCYGMSVITALTAQNTRGVSGVQPVPSQFIKAQMDAVFKDMRPQATKIGMLYSVEQVEVVAQNMKKYHVANVVLDPVMASQGGARLLEAQAVTAFKELLMPLATLVTPNLPEASVLLNSQLHTPQEIREGARQLASYGHNSVLLKGGHMGGDRSNDLLFLGPENRFVLFEEKRISTLNDHGTGCTLSSAVASFLAQGEMLEGAVRAAKAYLTAALRAGAAYEIGKGRGPVHHFYGFW
ncbi:MAG: bifunctional hydroxymethylpyrimidine kinase/phosphomethylpyrimidine kinase [Desulfatiglandaceae bacterium]